MKALAVAIAAIAALSASAQARLDLTRASVERLDNGLTLIMLEDRERPIVSIQTVYGVGAKDDPAGRIGLAHFFEHMAFRGSKNFPDTGLVSEIYAVGGEWHGYTWIDLTTYFATTPKENLPLLLDIEADRMARLDLRAEDLEAERGAVIAEMNGYANDPDSTLFDALLATHFLTHPYRNNTIGYRADIGAITHPDVVEFYEHHYAPKNAIIALVGDFDREAARTLIKERFSPIKKDVAARAPLTDEWPRSGERRVRLTMPAPSKLLKIAYPAPAASDHDFAAFLVLQAIIGETSGVNFNQNDWGTLVGAASPLASVADDARSWIIPTAAPYAFVFSASAPANANEAKIENRVQQALDRVAARPIPAADLAAAKSKLKAALAFDVDTTEEAAHQLAYFAGVNAFDALLSLPADIDAVTAEKVQAVAAKYLRADRRTIAWLTPGPAIKETPPAAPAPAAARAGAPAENEAAPAAEILSTPNGAPLLFQPSSLSPSFALSAVLAGRFSCALCVADAPAPGDTTIAVTGTADDLEYLFIAVAAAVRAATPVEDAAPASDDPLTRLEEIFAAGVSAPPGANAPYVIAASGEASPETVKALSDRYLAFPLNDAKHAAPVFAAPIAVDVVIDEAKAQSALGFYASAPAADAPEGLATAIALYALSHGYEGRLGKEAISRRGLAYYIDAQYRAGRGGGLVTLAAGVDPEKAAALKSLIASEIARLAAEPPTEAEIAEAKRYLVGRKISAAQSNGEIVGALTADFLGVGAGETPQALASRLETIGRDDVARAAAAIAQGAIVTVGVKGID